MDSDYELIKKLQYAPVKCPVCGQTSDSVKSYTIPDFAYLIVTIRGGHHRYVACARCMRKKILISSALGLIKANIMWPLFYLPRNAVNLTRTFVRGHSEDIIAELEYKSYQQWK